MEGEALHSHIVLNFICLLYAHAQTHTTDLTSWICRPVFHTTGLCFLENGTILCVIFKCFMWHIKCPFLVNKLEDRGSYHNFSFLLENNILYFTHWGKRFLCHALLLFNECAESTSLLGIYVAFTIKKSSIHEFQNFHKRNLSINNGLWWGWWNWSIKL